ncbi:MULTISPECIES: outer membrane protein [Rhizobium]|uniref:Secreted protein n=1 Tax=Rhizobium favelukesii TaxID=348824 RepID=W6RNM1_9HYPH|nr:MULTISPECIES: outer membrane beta-barrel protein [Rhizobium]MCA0805769.1 outer membrane beta-barrel protein [Rhizobium sp. T1473]MCS0457844.1 outer membrane beta-barrel protein [Rhizobium favelukesii]UFS80490.1 outer membrane beta-barrel protein [Rhizobium sp. T136]CDM62344.1 putative secreted protein [Rhizobium favelukesii]
MRRTHLLLVALLSTVSFTAAQAADLVAPTEQPINPVVLPSTSGFYIGSTSSVNFLDDTGFDVFGVRVSTDYDAGFYTSLRAGYDFGAAGWVSPRLELELGYGTASVDEHSVAGIGSIASIDSFGDARQFQGYVNGYIDVPLTSAIKPFVGGGVGFMNLELRKQGVAGVATLMDDSDTAFAYHLDAGVGIDIQGLGLFTNTSLFQNTTFEVGYRYTAADDFDFTARDGTSSSTDFTSNSVTLGFRKKF